MEQVEPIEQGQHGSVRAWSVRCRFAQPVPGTERDGASTSFTSSGERLVLIGGGFAAAWPALKVVMASGGGCVSNSSIDEFCSEGQD